MKRLILSLMHHDTSLGMGGHAGRATARAWVCGDTHPASNRVFRAERRDFCSREGPRPLGGWDRWLVTVGLVCLGLIGQGNTSRVVAAEGTPIPVEVKDASIEGQLDGDTGKLVIQATLGGISRDGESSVYGATFYHWIRPGADQLTHTVTLRAEAIRAGLREVVVVVKGTGEIQEVTGDALEDWSERRTAAGGRALVLRFKSGDKVVKTASARVRATTRWTTLPADLDALTFSVEPAVLGSGYVILDSGGGLQSRLTGGSTLVP
ncbi:MAG: hypothetical protein JNK85_04870, partial [Verrucomicrobiales bacterium]|nr:hypothetical protein [Verrucomicrobiales bacterium]